MKKFRKSTFVLFLIEENDIYQILLVPWKNIVPSRSYRWSKVGVIYHPPVSTKFWKTGFLFSYNVERPLILKVLLS